MHLSAYQKAIIALVIGTLKTHSNTESITCTAHATWALSLAFAARLLPILDKGPSFFFSLLIFPLSFPCPRTPCHAATRTSAAGPHTSSLLLYPNEGTLEYRRWNNKKERMEGYQAIIPLFLYPPSSKFSASFGSYVEAPMFFCTDIMAGKVDVDVTGGTGTGTPRMFMFRTKLRARDVNAT
ncbi:hypothetical protein DFH27DRAFT_540608, partial [Peziza echinospora]